MICKQCGYNNDEKNTLCDACGSPLRTEAQFNATQNKYVEIHPQNTNYYNQQNYQPYNPYASVPQQNCNQQYYQNQTMRANTINNQNVLPMNFHIVYCVYLFFTAFSNLSSLFAFFNIDGMFLYAMSSLLNITFLVATGILLLKRKKIGYIFRSIHNILAIAFSVLLVLLGFIGMVVGFFNPTIISSDESLNGIMVFIFIILLIIAVPTFVINLLVMKYYKKRKQLFT